MTDIYVRIIYDIDKDEFDVSSNASDHKKIVSEFLRTQIGSGVDDHEPNKQKKYTILIDLDLSQDFFSVSNDCGNKGLRDGILQRFLDS